MIQPRGWGRGLGEVKSGLNDTEHELGKEGTSRKVSLTKMKSISEGQDVDETQDTASSGTVERKPWVSSQVSSTLDHGNRHFPCGPQRPKWVLKLLPKRVGML
jgi:hypothetical protein